MPDPDVVFRDDSAAPPAGAPSLMRGARAVAGYALTYSRQARFVQPALVNGTAGLASGLPGLSARRLLLGSICRDRSARLDRMAWLVRSELIYLLVSLDRQYTAEAPGEPWETWYARQILRHFRPSGS